MLLDLTAKMAVLLGVTAKVAGLQPAAPVFIL